MRRLSEVFNPVIGAGLIFACTVLLALLPKSPVEPLELPHPVRWVAGQIGGKYWWVLLVGGTVAVWMERRLFGRLFITLLLTQVAIEVFKFTVAEMRPDGRFFNSFPSGHTAASFAFATVMASHFRWGWLWFLFATLVGISRILTNAHWWHDVVGGAALGYIVAVGARKLERLVRSRISPAELSSVPEQPKHLGSSEQSKHQVTQNAGQDE